MKKKWSEKIMAALGWIAFVSFLLGFIICMMDYVRYALVWLGFMLIGAVALILYIIIKIPSIQDINPFGTGPFGGDWWDPF